MFIFADELTYHFVNLKKMYFQINLGRTDMFIILSSYPRIVYTVYSNLKSLRNVLSFLQIGFAYFVLVEL